MPPRRRKPAPTKRTVRPAPVTLQPAPGEYVWILNVPFEERAIANANGALWDSARRAIVYLGPSMPRNLAPYAAPVYSWERYQQDIINQRKQKYPPPTSRLIPRKSQIEAANAINAAALAGYPGFAELDEVGTGKCVGPKTPVWLNGEYISAQDAWEKYASNEQWTGIEGQWANPSVLLTTLGNVNSVKEEVKVNRLYRQRISEPVREITLADNKTIIITQQHKLLTPNGWTRQVNVGDCIAIPKTNPQNAASNNSSLDSSSWVQVETIKIFRYDGWVYDFEVPQGHNYLAAGMWCHNTISCWEGLRKISSHRPIRRILIGCPIAVIPQWTNTIADQGDLGAHIVVVNYDRFKKLLTIPASAGAAKKTSTKNKRIAKDGEPSVMWDAIIFDECHLLKTFGMGESSQRAAASAQLARYSAAPKDKPFVIWASGTPGQNPTDLGYMAPLLAHLTNERVNDFKHFGSWFEKKGFDVTYNTKTSKWTWNPNEVDVKKIRTLLFDRDVPAAIRRLPDWAEVQRIPMPVVFDVHERALYNKAWTEFREQMQLARKGRDAKAGLVARLRFLQKASLLRVPGTVEHIMNLLDNGRQVAVSVRFIETLTTIEAALAARRVTCTTIDGRPETNKEQNRLMFQRGQHKVVLFTVTAGISLQAKEPLPDGTIGSAAPRATIIHDPRYSGLDTTQIEGRAHRSFQLAPAFYMYAQDSAEGSVLTILLKNMIGMKNMVGDDVTLLHELDDALMREPTMSDDPFFAPQVEPHLVRAEILTNPGDKSAAPQSSLRQVAPPNRPLSAVSRPAVATTSTTEPRSVPARTAPSRATIRVSKLPTRPTARQSFKEDLAGGKITPVASQRLTAAERERLRRQIAGE